MTDLQSTKSSVLQRLEHLLAQPFLRSPRTLLGLWTLLALVAGLTKMSPARHNNFLIFRGVFDHLTQQLSLYAEYPEEYFDHNHYGPFFSLVIAPFAVVPDVLGLLLWLVALSLGLYWAVRRLPLEEGKQAFVYWFCAHELLTALQMQQFNIAIAAILVGSFAAIERRQEWLAALLIVVGTFVKLYGIVGLALFFFVQRKPRFILWLALWSVVCLVSPMLLSSPDYVLGQYQEWAERLAVKNGENLFSLMQNVSLLGMVRKVTGIASYSDLWLILPGLVVFGLPYLRIGQYRHLAFRYGILSSALLFLVLFSTGSESSSYIIALSGVCVWYFAAPWQRGKADIWLLVFVFLLSSMGSSDLYPRAIKREYIQAYSLKALPCLIVWLKLCWEMMVKNYEPHPQTLTKGRGE